MAEDAAKDAACADGVVASGGHLEVGRPDAWRRLTDTERLDAEAVATSERQFAVLAESLPQIVWRADANGLLTYVNKTWMRCVGFHARHMRTV